MSATVPSGTVLQGARAPRALVLDLVPSDDVPDLSIITAASLEVHRKTGTVEDWTCAMSNQTETTLTLTHPWTAGDNDVAGETLRIYAQLTISGQINEAARVTVTVTPR